MTRTNSGVRPRHLLPIAVGLAAGIYMLSGSVPRLAAQVAGVEGTFLASRCVAEQDSDGDEHWMCEGSFAAGDGSFTIPRVEVDTSLDTRPDGPRTAFVLGPSADTAVQPGVFVWLGPGAVGVLSLVFPVWAVGAASRDALARGRRRGRASGAPAAGASGASGVPGVPGASTAGPGSGAPAAGPGPEGAHGSEGVHGAGASAARAQGTR
ncbi:hypothetical protein ACFXKW_34500 [Streptomyces sp. NPDC059193]|uniref:hypothetical protein n=1 Tax=Streptomyces sp. NPDC059193 TaxID=3346763 RepID=UPI0036CC66EB